MNNIDDAQLSGMFLNANLAELRKIIYTCTAAHPTHHKARYAPSIVTRSELELFGLSSPRFAARFYVDDNRRFFINARRLTTIGNTNPSYSQRLLLPDVLQHPKLEFDQVRFDEEMSLKEQLQSQPCVADCFLPPPDKMAHFHHHLCDLASAYGETTSLNTNYAGSPFMRHIHLSGGGLCAQAVCFMATVLHYRHAARVHGLAEITYLASAPEKPAVSPRELLISGLDFREMTQYFSRAGLTSVWQRLTLTDLSKPQIKIFEQAVRAYLLSDMPVIFAMDCALMDGQINNGYVPKEILDQPKGLRPIERNEWFYHYNETPPPGGAFSDFPYNYHAVIATGVTSNPADPIEFSIHDPLTNPFMKAKSAHLIDAAAWLREPSELGKKPHRSTAGYFLPVTPPNVALPLGLWSSDEELAANPLPSPIKHGLIAYIIRINRAIPDFANLRLIQCSDIVRAIETLCDVTNGFLGGSAAAEGLVQESPSIMVALEKMLFHGRKHWLWIHCEGQQVSFWDAEFALPSSQQMMPSEIFRQRCLVAELRIQSSKWQLDKNRPDIISDAPDSSSGENTSAVGPGLDRSLITSFSVSGIEDAIRTWPSSSEDAPAPHLVDLYTFMQSDADRLLARHVELPPEAIGNAVYLMSALAENDKIISETAKILHDAFQPRSIKIAAFATFIPEITRHSEATADVGKKSIKFLVKLARELQRSKHPVTSIELVTGSLIDGIWPATIKNEIPETQCHGATLLDWQDSLKTLLARLRSIVETIRDTAPKEGHQPLHLALELEPGPLYILGSLERVEYLCDLLDKKENSDISPFVGLNIDIPHWGFLADLTPSDLKKDAIFRRVSHAHISDHVNGHFCDNIPLLIHKHQDFYPWLDVLEERRARNSEFVAQGYPSFSGCVALEMEATKSADQVQAGHYNLYQLIHRSNGVQHVAKDHSVSTHL